MVTWADDRSTRDQSRDASAAARDRSGRVAGAAIPGLGRLCAHPKGDLPMTDPRHLASVRDGEQAERMIERAAYEIRRVIAGQDLLLERTFVALLARGHLLIEGVPGLAKTLTIRTVASVLGGTFQRVQFTPDLVPSDLVGTRIYRARSSSSTSSSGLSSATSSSPTRSTALRRRCSPRCSR